VLDPQATVTRAMGYRVYDTLIAMDQQGRFHPQMLKKWDISDNRLTWIFTLQPGLAWHDGAPATADDCIALLRRWAHGDSFGKRPPPTARPLLINVPSPCTSPAPLPSSKH
jgi:peptide/nickel transport system substrate-binding protein